MSELQHVFEVAPSARSKCRGCNRAIEKGALRFGERLPNPFGDGEMTHWHHPLCSAYRRPQSLLATLSDYPADEDEPDSDSLKQAAELAIAHPRLQRMGVIEQASSGRARCRHCEELIAQHSWRVPLIFFNDDAYNASGFIHAGCVNDYCGTNRTWPTIACFAGQLDADVTAELTALLTA
ncbi:MAG: hypothetical protein RIC89_09510 [Pseudomonadales bacterium]